MTELANGYSVRAAGLEDIAELTDLVNEYWEVLTGIVKFSIDEMKNMLLTPGFDMESSLQVVLSPQEEIVACGMVMDLSNPPVHPNVYGCVRQGYEGRGLGTTILNWAEKRATRAIERCPAEARVSMYVQTAPSHQATVHLLEKQGLTPARYSWIMMKDLNEPLPKPNWPEGIRIRTFADYNHLETILMAVNEAFKDHWGYVDRSGDAEWLRRYRHQIENDPDFDPSLWILAMEGKEIAGVSLCNPKLGTDRETGTVEPLGVRRPWRRNGLGLALLQHTFGEFQKRGYQRVALSVDTQNLSGATRLYQKAGMQVAREFVVYEKELRAGEEISKQA